MIPLEKGEISEILSTLGRLPGRRGTQIRNPSKVTEVRQLGRKMWDISQRQTMLQIAVGRL